MRLRIRSVKNIAQVTRAMQAVSASRVRRAMQQVQATRAYAGKAWQVLTHIARQPGGASLHPLLVRRPSVEAVLVVLITGDRGLAGAYNTNVVRATLQHFRGLAVPVNYIAVGRKGRDLLVRRRQRLLAEYSQLPAAPSFADVSAIGRQAVDEFLNGRADEVILAYTDFVSMARQVPSFKRLLPLEVHSEAEHVDEAAPAGRALSGAYMYEPGQTELLDQIIPRFTALQVYQAILESLASEHAARMVAMQNATENANELVGALQLAYNKVRQATITGDLLDIAGGAEALARA